MKFRQAKKIVEHCDEWRGRYRFTPPWYKKACDVYNGDYDKTRDKK